MKYIRFDEVYTKHHRISQMHISPSERYPVKQQKREIGQDHLR